MTSPLDGQRVVITRSQNQNASLRRLLESQGAVVIEVPLIAINEPEDEGRERDAVLQRCHEFDWIVVTSPNGATRAAPFLNAAVAAGDVRVPRIAVVGRATQDSLGMSAHLVAHPATAHCLVEMFPEGHGKVLVVQGNLADEVVSDGVSDKGWNVTKVVAYLTTQLVPTTQQRDDALSADVLLLASSSAVSAWCDAFGTESPDIVVAIGPSTASTATSLGLGLTAIAQDQSLQGLIEAVIEVIGDR